MKPSLGLEDLPTELIIRILSHVDHGDLLRSICPLSKYWYRLVHNKCLWRCVSWSCPALRPSHLTHLLRRDLIGSHTQSLSIHLAGGSVRTQPSLQSVFRSCSSLQKFCLTSGCMDSFVELWLSLPRSLQVLKLHSLTIKPTSKPIEYSRKLLPQLTILDLSGCGWITDVQLKPLLNPTHLTQLDLNGCYRLFSGPPANSDIIVRINRLSTTLCELCPQLTILGLRSVFTLPLDAGDTGWTRDAFLLNRIVRNLPKLMVLDISSNKSLTDYLSFWLSKTNCTTIRSFITEFLNLADGRLKTIHTQKLIIRDWPLDCVKALLMEVYSSDNPTSSSLTVVVDSRLQYLVSWTERRSDLEHEELYTKRFKRVSLQSEVENPMSDSKICKY
ncbi:hypothetical protein EG68_11649 [Paragonimus skrjabini miyazakii]|uniref:F-box domain-containing protein n=1 Tax=Paragonimus skrjabini miyazakii TaxID=59628 RepID=A0A8S9Y9H4_9TREM|nr:hypothetical protein EG68_11649 [Paragonimus skrjabini miyazakii]